MVRSINNTPDDKIIERLRALTVNVLEPVREHFGPIRVSSGYRCEELNEAIGGASSSQHTFGEAADISSSSASPFIISNWIIENIPQFDQCIYEGSWVHISYSTRHINRKVSLTAVFTKNSPTQYMSGIIDKS